MHELRGRPGKDGIRLTLLLILATGLLAAMASPGLAGGSGAPEVRLAQTQPTTPELL